MKTYELFELTLHGSDPGGWFGRSTARMRIGVQLGLELTEEYADYIVRHAIEQSGGYYEKGDEVAGMSIYYPSFPSKENAERALKVLRRLSRGKPRFKVEIVNLRGQAWSPHQAQGIIDWQVVLEPIT